MFYLVSTRLDKNKLIYDIIEEFNTIKEAYDYLYNHNYKKYISDRKIDHYYNDTFKNVSIWKEKDIDQILSEYLGEIFCLI